MGFPPGTWARLCTRLSTSGSSARTRRIPTMTGGRRASAEEERSAGRIHLHRQGTCDDSLPVAVAMRLLRPTFYRCSLSIPMAREDFMIPQEKSEAVIRGLREAFGAAEFEHISRMSGGHTSS